jgi:hypothetical protein
MALQLRDNLSFCICDGRVVFLDLEADRYFCLGPALETAFHRWVAAPSVAGIGDDLGLLCERGLLVPARGTLPTLPDPGALPAVRDLDPQCAPRFRDVARAIAAQLSATASIRRRPLTKILGRHAMSVPPTGLVPEQGDSRAAQIAAAFARSALIMGSSDRCLARALAAMSMCRRSRLGAILVFGVRLDPFTAHCWVQRNDQVLVGEFDQARLFTPILSAR